MPADTPTDASPAAVVNGADKYLPAWTIGALPDPPRPGWRLWVGLLGPGVVLAGTSVGSGEWLFGPAVSAQYGATLLWLASISILLQVFCNLMMMRYTLYCGEPIIVGGLRTWPGPAFWIGCYAILDIAAIWPYNASNAAVPLAAALLGHLPGGGSVEVFGGTITETQLVRALGITIFLLSFVPLIFGGTIYRMLEKVMTLKLVLVLGYLTFVAVFMASPRVGWEVMTGFFRFGQYPERADTVIAGRHFTLTDWEDGQTYVLKGLIEDHGPLVTELRVAGVPVTGELPLAVAAKRKALLAQAQQLAQPGAFFVEKLVSPRVRLRAEGRIVDDVWQPQRITIIDRHGATHYKRVDEVPSAYASRLAELIANQGAERHSLVRYVWQNGRLPNLDWFTLAAFAAIAGAGGLTNTMFSNYTRDKGWGMGSRVGAIPSAIGGRAIDLSHVGQVFPPDQAQLPKWRGWMRHVVRDQLAVWMIASFVGMALPCVLSLQFIRNSTVVGDRVAAMTAEAIALRYPDYGTLLWTLTLLCGFLVLMPGQISVGDQIARRWTDIVWSTSQSARRLKGSHVKYVYYGILSIYGVWGFIILLNFPALQIAKIGAVLGNIALGFSALHAWYANRMLLPQRLQPHWLLQIGALACGLFFIGISLVVMFTL